MLITINILTMLIFFSNYNLSGGWEFGRPEKSIGGLLLAPGASICRLWLRPPGLLGGQAPCISIAANNAPLSKSTYTHFHVLYRPYQWQIQEFSAGRGQPNVNKINMQKKICRRPWGGGGKALSQKITCEKQIISAGSKGAMPPRTPPVRHRGAIDSTASHKSALGPYKAFETLTY